jgi:hypothetical protein
VAQSGGRTREERGTRYTGRWLEAPSEIICGLTIKFANSSQIKIATYLIAEYHCG